MSLTLARTVVEGLDPRELSNLEYWYDAQFPNGFGAVQPHDGDQIAQVSDLSGNSRHMLQAAPASRGYYRAANWNRLTANGTTVPVLTTSTGSGIATSTGASAASVIGLVTPYYGCLSCIQFTVAGNTNVSIFATDYVPVTPGNTYSGLGAIRGVAGAQAKISIFWYDANKAIIGTAAGLPITMADIAGAFTQTALAAIAPDGATQARVVWVPVVPVAGQLHQVVGFGLGSGTVPAAYYSAPGNVAGIHLDGLTALYSLTVLNKSITGPNFTAYVAAQRLWASGADMRITDGNSVGRTITRYAGAGFGFGTVRAGAYSERGAAISPAVLAPFISSAYADTASTHIRINGGVDGANAYGSPSADLIAPITLGGVNGSVSFGGIIQTVMLFSRTHDAATRRRVENWLAARQGITLARP